MLFISASIFTLFILLVIVITLANVGHTRTLTDVLNIRMSLSHGFSIPIFHKMVRGGKISLEHGFLVDGTVIEAVVHFCVEERSLRIFW